MPRNWRGAGRRNGNGRILKGGRLLSRYKRPFNGRILYRPVNNGSEDAERHAKPPHRVKRAVQIKQHATKPYAQE